jgi:hypothetical protein
MPRISKIPLTLLEKAAKRVGVAIAHATLAPNSSADGIVPGSIAWYLRDKRARQALVVILDAMDERQSQRLLSDFQNNRPGPLTQYVIHMAFLESASPPVRPLALHPDLADWLLALPDDQAGWHPADPCWACGYKYPFRPGPDVPFAVPPSAEPCVVGSPFGAEVSDSRPRPKRAQIPENHGRESVDVLRSSRPTKPAPIHHRTGLAEPTPHPWVGRQCLYCRGLIVNHVDWLDPNARRTLTHFQNAPYRLNQQSMAAGWRRELDAVELPKEWQL